MGIETMMILEIMISLKHKRYINHYYL